MGEIKLAISGQQLGGFGKSLREVLSVLKSFSVSWVELWTFNLVGGFQGRKCNEDDLKKTKEVLDEYGIGVACVTNGDAFAKEMAE
jgi:hypothetical protein